MNLNESGIYENIEALYISYDEIVTEFTEEKIKSRYALLYQELSDFLIIYFLGENYRIDQIALTNAILDYFTDISGLKKLYNFKNVNEIKGCAHQCYWFLRKIIFIEKNRTKGNDKKNYRPLPIL